MRIITYAIALLLPCAFLRIKDFNEEKPLSSIENKRMLNTSKIFYLSHFRL